MTGEQKIGEWLERHPAAMYSQLGLTPPPSLLSFGILGRLRPGVKYLGE